MKCTAREQAAKTCNERSSSSGPEGRSICPRGGTHIQFKQLRVVSDGLTAARGSQGPESQHGASTHRASVTARGTIDTPRHSTASSARQLQRRTCCRAQRRVGVLCERVCARHGTAHVTVTLQPDSFLTHDVSLRSPCCCPSQKARLGGTASQSSWGLCARCQRPGS